MVQLPQRYCTAHQALVTTKSSLYECLDTYFYSLAARCLQPHDLEVHLETWQCMVRQPTLQPELNVYRESYTWNVTNWCTLYNDMHVVHVLIFKFIVHCRFYREYWHSKHVILCTHSTQAIDTFNTLFSLFIIMFSLNIPSHFFVTLFQQFRLLVKVLDQTQYHHPSHDSAMCLIEYVNVAVWDRKENMSRDTQHTLVCVHVYIGMCIGKPKLINSLILSFR